MTQALRVALWVPTDPDTTISDGVFTNGAAGLADVFPTRFDTGGGGGGGGIEEAPVDGKQYARADAMWKEVEGAVTAGIPEAPANGTPYVRQDINWLSFAVIDAGNY